MPVQYYFDNLDPLSFQRLVNALLTARYGEALRLLPLRGADGGRDAETAVGSQWFELDVQPGQRSSTKKPPPPGKYIFQVKHHRTADRQGTALRSSVLADFTDELMKNVLSHAGSGAIYFFLVTNVAGTKESFAKVDEKRQQLLTGTKVHADVLWQEHLTAWLDQLPQVWPAFREIFSGQIVPALGELSLSASTGIPRTLRLSISRQFERDAVVRFRQINLEQRLSHLFVDLEAHAPRPTPNEGARLFEDTSWDADLPFASGIHLPLNRVGSIALLVSESPEYGTRLILEGGPGQGKSTITQAVAQLYRALILDRYQEYKRICAELPKARLPFRVELRAFAEWLATTDRSVEEYLAETFSKDAGGAELTVEHIHSTVENSPSLLIFDGLDEVGSDDLRNIVIEKIVSCVARFESDLRADLRCIVTSRPPAVAGCADRMKEFKRCQVLPLNPQKVTEYSQRWANVQCSDDIERERVIASFEKRKGEQHVAALVKNPMQLSVLLHFIRLKGEAFPDRRAELYREYFKTVIDRDVEKSPDLRKYRDEIEALHEVIAFEIHTRAETDLAKTQLSRPDLLNIISKWLEGEGRSAAIGQELFRLGEERLGLIVALKGEGANVRYGFEVQPVREYFAAAFINDKREGDAHELFQAMIRRPFWREVALFLAGLRRVNERADLLSRARDLDEDPVNGWRQQGRALVLQLLTEGVLSSPGHVCRDAIAFVSDLLNPLNRAARNEPNEWVYALAKLMQASGTDEHKRTLTRYLADSSSCDDRHSLWRLYAVASRVLPQSTVWTFIDKFQSSRAGMTVLVKLLWPATNGMDLWHNMERDKMPELLTSPDWAETWFRTALRHPALRALVSTAKYHGLLAEMFAFEGIPILDHRHLDDPIDTDTTSLALWQLCENVQNITSYLMSPGESSSHVPRRFRTTAIYEGLGAPTLATVRSLVESSAQAVELLRDGKPVGRALKSFLTTLDDQLLGEGLSGWIACRCASMLMFAVEFPYHFEQENYTLRVNHRRADALARNPEWATVRRSLTKFFRTGIPEDLDKAGRTNASRIIRAGYAWSLPSHVIESGELRSVPQMLVKSAIEGNLASMTWVNRAPIARYWLKEMLSYRSNPGELEKVLTLFARRPSDWGGPSAGLTLIEMKKISVAANRSGDPEVLAGALSALIGSRFINVVGISATMVMLGADARFRDVGSRLFPSGRQTDGPVTAKMVHLADAVISSAEKFSQSTVVAAARFLAERKSESLTPLGSLIP